MALIGLIWQTAYSDYYAPITRLPLAALALGGLFRLVWSELSAIGLLQAVDLDIFGLFSRLMLLLLWYRGVIRPRLSALFRSDPPGIWTSVVLITGLVCFGGRQADIYYYSDPGYPNCLDGSG